MKTGFAIICFLLLASIGMTQTFLDAANTPAIVNAYQLDAAPAIDGTNSGWEAIPWTELYFNDHDWNGDTFQDPLPDKRDFMARYKMAWVEGDKQLYIIMESRDNEFVSVGDVVDGFVISIDPLNEKTVGLPGSDPTHSDFAISFPVGAATHTGFAGTTVPMYTGAAQLNSDVFPGKACLEIAITLPDGVTMAAETKMGFYLQIDDVDAGLEHTLVPWPPLWKENQKIMPRASKDDVSKWGELKLSGKPVHVTVAEGSSIQGAIDDASGDLTVITLAGGNFSDNLFIGKSGIYITGSTDDTNPSILMSDDRTWPIITVEKEAMGTVIENMTIGGFNGDSTLTEAYALGVLVQGRDTKLRHCKGLWLADPVKVVDAEACIIENNYIRMMGQVESNSKSDLQFNGGGLDNTVCRYNTISRGWVNGSCGIEVNGLYGDVCLDFAFNNISDCRESQIEISTLTEDEAFDLGSSLDLVVTLHHNIFYNTIQQMEWAISGEWSWAGQGGPDDAMELKMYYPATIYVYNNTANRNRGEFLEHNNDAPTLCRNNIATNSYTQEDYDFRGDPPPEVDYSLSYGNAKPEIIYEIGDAACIIDDPLYVDPDNDNYALQSDSPAIDAGEKEPFGFKVFFVGDAPDIGAVEYGVAEFQTNVEHRFDGLQVVSGFELYQNYPNPFNPITTISFQLYKDAHVRLDIYNVNGQLVDRLFNQKQTAGSHTIRWNAKDVPSGLYFYTFTINGQHSVTKKMMLVK